MSSPLGALADALGRLGVADAAFGLWQRAATLGAPEKPGLPPAYLRMLTAGVVCPVAFERVGRLAAEQVLALAARHDRSPGADDRVFDFGCGCGRVAAPFGRLSAARLHGCDVNGRLVDWCRRNLPGEYRRTEPEPPLPYPDRAFALVYSHSVFTHLHERPALAWLGELARITRPGGLAILSFFDQDVPAADAFRDELMDRGFLVRREGAEGSNLLSVYYSRDGFAARAAPRWRPLQIVEAHVSPIGQAVAVLERT